MRRDRLITRVVGSLIAHACGAIMQNRAQTFLDSSRSPSLTALRNASAVMRTPVGRSSPLQHGSQMAHSVVSERTGWRHLYHYSAAGVLIRPVTPDHGK